MPYQVKWKGGNTWWPAANGFFEKKKDAEEYVKKKRSTQVYLIRWKVEKIVKKEVTK